MYSYKIVKIKSGFVMVLKDLPAMMGTSKAKEY